MALKPPDKVMPAPVRVFISIGSNIEPLRHVRMALQALAQHFGPLLVSSVYRSQAAGFAGDDFLNLVAGFSTAEPPRQIVTELERIHEAAGRGRDEHGFSSRTLDLDLLLYGDQVLEEPEVPRRDILEYSFVLGPLAEIAPGLRHPVTGQTMAEMWSCFDQRLHPLHKLPATALQDAGQ